MYLPSRIYKSLFLTFGIIWVLSSYSSHFTAFLSGKGSTILQETPVLKSFAQIQQPTWHAAALEASTASRDLTLGILLILLGLGMYVFWNIQSRTDHSSKRIHKTITRGYREWFWIKFP